MTNLQIIIFIIFFVLLLLMFFEFGKFRKVIFLLNMLILLFLIEIHFNYSIWNFVFLSVDIWKISIIFVLIFTFSFLVNLIKDFRFEILFLYIMVFIGSIIIVLCDNLILIYLGLEMQTFSLFILISKNRNSVRSSESSLKYFILGALSSGLFLLGVTFIFSQGLSINLKDLTVIYTDLNLIIQLSFFLVAISLFFKLALFPLHFWIPDIYEGSSWDIISLIATLPKISVLSIILQILFNSNFFIISSILSIIIGTIGAMNQTKIKRLLAYSGISHVGFIMLGLILLSKQGYEIGFIYLFIYIINILGIFLVIYNSNFTKNYFIIELSNVNITNKIFGLTWLILILSIAGIPPLSGFISKWVILNALIDYNYIISALIGIIFSAIAVGYYLRIIKIIYFQKYFSYLSWESVLKLRYYENNFNITNYLLGFVIYVNIALIFYPSLIFTPFYLGFNYFF